MQDPTVARALQMTQGKSSQEIMQLAENLSQNMHGIPLAQYRQHIGV